MSNGLITAATMFFADAPIGSGNVNRRVAYLISILIFVPFILSVFSISAYAMDREEHRKMVNSRLAKMERIKRTIERKGTTKILVELNVDRAPAAALKNRSVGELNKKRISRTRNRVVDRLPERVKRRLKNNEHSGFIALDADSETLEQLERDPDVKAIYEDKLKGVSLIESVPLTGASLSCTEGNCGAGQTIAILDTGVDLLHPFIGGRIVHQACYSTTNISDSATSLCPDGSNVQLIGSAGIACSTGLQGCDHGTHVAGIALGNGSLGGVPFDGMAPNATMMPIQVFSRFEGAWCSDYDLPSPCVLAYTSDVIAGLEHVYNQRDNFNIAAVNLSLGQGDFSDPCNAEPETAIINLLTTAGIAVVVSSGNDASTTTISSPACVSSAISVGSTTKFDSISYFSNSADMLDLLAPGSAINSSIPGGGYASFDGTSMAAPHVSGAIALMRSALGPVPVYDLEGALKSNGVVVEDYRNRIQKPRVQVHDAITNFNYPPNLNITSPEDGSTVTAGEPVTLAATATDAEEGDLSGSIGWSSGLDGYLGVGPTLTDSFCAGTKFINATVFDVDGAFASDFVVVDVQASGLAPTANDDVLVVQEDTDVIIPILENDTVSGNDFINGTTLLTQPTNGSVVEQDRNHHYIPEPNFHGVDNFTYSVDSCHGGSDTASVSITVSAVNDAPTALNDNLATAEDTPVSINVLANDSDIENDELTILSVSPPINGTAINNDGIITYTPNSVFNGVEQFTYTVTDGNGGFTVGTVTIIVSEPSVVLSVPNDYGTIQSALDAAEDGDIILVDPGVYEEKINFLGKEIKLFSVSGPESTIIDGQSTGTTVTLGSNSEISGFTITNGHTNYNARNGGGMSVSGTGAIVHGNIFDGNQQSSGGHGAAIGGYVGSVKIEKNLFINSTCISQSRTGVISFDSSSFVSIVNNIIADNDCNALQQQRPGEIINNTIVRNNEAILGNSIATYRNNIIVDNAVGLNGSATVFENNLVWGNDIDYLDVVPYTGSYGNLAQDPKFANSLNDFRISAGSPAIDNGSTTSSPADDYAGTRRPNDGDTDGTPQFDIGAYEYTRYGNIAPVAIDDYATTLVGTSIEIAATANDSDVDFDSVSIIDTGEASHGQVTHSESGVTYLPNAGFFGLDEFTYTISDGAGGAASATVRITVTVPGNNLPELVISAPENGTPFTNLGDLSFVAVANDSEDGDISSSIEWSSNIDGILGTGGTIVASLSIGTHRITASATDSFYGTNETSVVVTVHFGFFITPFTQIERHKNIVYFLDDGARTIRRFDIAEQQFLYDIVLQQAVQKFHVDDDGIYVSNAGEISRYSLDGVELYPITTLGGSIDEMVSNLDYLYAIYRQQPYGKVTSISKQTSQQIEIGRYRNDYFSGPSISSESQKIFARDTGSSPSDIFYVPLNADGTLGNETDSPYHGDYPSALYTYMMPNEDRVVDDSGTIYNVADLTYSNSLGGSFDDIAFGDGISVVRRGAILHAYSSSFLETGIYETTREFAKIYIHNENIYGFYLDVNGKIAIDTIPLALLMPLIPGEPIDPSGLAYVPDDIEYDLTHGIVYLFSKQFMSIFRWSLDSNSYLPSIPLAAEPSHIAFSEETNRLYLTYDTGKINQIRINESLEEVPFTTSPGAPNRISTAGEYVFVVDPTGAWASHFIYAPSGQLISQEDWNQYTNEFIWNKTNRRMYFFRSGSPRDLMSEEIFENGVIGTKMDSPLHAGAGFTYPINVDPKGNVVVLGSGRVFDARTLEYTNDISNSIKDATWTDSGALVSVRDLGNQSSIQYWDNSSFAFVNELTYDGDPIALQAFGNYLLLISSINGAPVFTSVGYPLDLDNDGLLDTHDPDDDGDGLNDAEEDINSNGVVDEGETDPRDADTDGDGLNDSQDPYPLQANRTDTIQIPLLPVHLVFLFAAAILAIASRAARANGLAGEAGHQTK